MRNVIASWKRHGEHELTDDGRNNLQRLEKPRDNRLTLQSQPTHAAEPVDGLPGV